MADPIAFHFDFISPYAWPGAVGVEALAAKHGRTVDWHPMLLGVSVMKTMGLPPLMETPLKGDYIRMDVPRIYRFHGLDYRPAVPDFVTSPFAPARLFCWMLAQDRARATDAARDMLRAHWSEGIDVSQKDNAVAIATRHGFDRDAASAAPDDPTVKEMLKDACNRSVATGVFGSPSFIVDGELFWGTDRLPQIAWKLEQTSA